MKQKLQSKITAGLRANKFFYVVVGVFVCQAAWIALSGVYPMAFDESTHLGIIRLYAHKLLPFWSHMPPGPATYGAITRDPSYLYHYLMSFPYHLISLFAHTDTSQVIALRCINIALFAVGLVVWRSLLLRTTRSKALVHTVLAFFILTPIVPFLAAQINYDNLLFLLTATVLLVTIDFTTRLKKQAVLDLKKLVLIMTLGLLTSLVKYAFLPIFAAVIIWLGLVIYRYYRVHGRGELLQLAKRAYTGTTLRAKVVCCVVLLISGGLFVERYGVNTMLYGTPVPECNQVLPISDCMAYSPWLRNYQTEQDKLRGTLPAHSANPLTYTTHDWLKTSFQQLFFVINGQASGYKIANPLTIPLLLGEAVAALSVVLFIRMVLIYKKRHYSIGVVAFFGLVIGIYLTTLWIQNYGDYVHIGYAFGIQGRYLVPILPLIYVISAGALSDVMRRWVVLKSACAIGLLALLLLQGGGVATFIVRSDHSWYWPNTTVAKMNQGAQKFLKFFVIGS